MIVQLRNFKVVNFMVHIWGLNLNGTQTLAMFYVVLFLNSNVSVQTSLKENFLHGQLFFQCYHTTSATKKERAKLTGYFHRQSLTWTSTFFIYGSIWKLTTNVNHILNCCYVQGQSKFIMPKTKKNRFLKSFVPRSVQIF